VAGKTGTAQIAVNGKDYGYAGNRAYQASFVGYFPADNPLYTCIVIINSPTNGIYYGGAVAGPVFKEIAEKVYSTSVDFHDEINSGKKLLTNAPSTVKGTSKELKYVMTRLNVPFTSADNDEDFSYVYNAGRDSSKLVLTQQFPEKQLQEGVMPDLSGMSARDALYLLENNGLSVQLNGFGKVKKQSLGAGTKFTKGTRVILQLG
jgi:cell division protein FtsI (penicillin-binding protein 3)